jgi:3-dehydroquinate synthase
VNISNSTPVYGPEGYADLDRWLATVQRSKTFLLIDSNTAVCLPKVVQQLPHLDADYEVLEVDPGEESKSLEIAAQLWHAMLEYGADRHSILLNIGGGMVCDLGAFVASTFKRGIPFAQIPTSLLAMVDASVGGKNGVNFGGLKNQIGVFQQPDVVVIDPDHLSSLLQVEWQSGHGEMIKHSLISGKDWPQVLQLEPGAIDAASIARSVEVKLDVVREDFKESGRRKVLNFGHTFGHTWESLHYGQGDEIPHGFAVVQGLHLALMLSEEWALQALLAQVYPWEKVEDKYFDALWELQLADKKNQAGEVRFVLLNSLGDPVEDQAVDRALWERQIVALNAQSNG